MTIKLAAGTDLPGAPVGPAADAFGSIDPQGLGPLPAGPAPIALSGRMDGAFGAPRIIAPAWVLGAGDATAGVAVHAAADYPAVFDLASLNGANGFRIDHLPAGAEPWFPVASAGDVNGDGYDDIMIGAMRARADGLKEAGVTGVVFGGPASNHNHLSFNKLDGANGFVITGDQAHALAGFSAASAGDLNGDGYADMIVGAPTATNDAGKPSGESYVVFGHSGGFDASVSPADLDGTNGFRIEGVAAHDDAGISVASAGDVNADGYDDLIIGATAASPNGHQYAGSAFLVFGHAGGFPPSVDLSTLDGTDGARFDGYLGRNDNAQQQVGFWVSGAGDVNGDGYADFMLGSPYDRPDGETNYAGAVFVLFGHGGSFPSMSLDEIGPDTGFVMHGEIGDSAGARMGSAGDINGDGYGDLIVNCASQPSGAYVVLGHAGGFASIDLPSLDGSDGFRIEDLAGEWAGNAVSSAGDVNGDGFSDLLIGAPLRGYDPGHGAPGSAYVVFGKADGFSATLDLASLDGSNGFRIDGFLASSLTGGSVSAAGDVNGDGLGDLLIAASSGNQAYVVYGALPQQAVTRVGSAIGQAIHGGNFGDLLEGLGGDDVLYGHGGKDTLAGGAGADTLYGGAGKDVFSYEAVADSSSGAPDLIADLKAGDRIDLSAIDADLTQADDQAFHRVSGFTGQAGELVVSYDPGDDRTMVAGDVDGDGSADLVILIAGDHHDFAGLLL